LSLFEEVDTGTSKEVEPNKDTIVLNEDINAILAAENSNARDILIMDFESTAQKDPEIVQIAVYNPRIAKEEEGLHLLRLWPSERTQRCDSQAMYQKL
jgi:hypothetical protein